MNESKALGIDLNSSHETDLEDVAKKVQQKYVRWNKMSTAEHLMAVNFLSRVAQRELINPNITAIKRNP